MRPERKPLHANSDIDEIIMVEMRELGDTLRWQMNVHQALSSEKRFLNSCLGLRKRVAGSISVWGSEIVFLRLELDECLSIISRYFQAPTFLKYIPQKYTLVHKQGRTNLCENDAGGENRRTNTQNKK